MDIKKEKIMAKKIKPLPSNNSTLPIGGKKCMKKGGEVAEKSKKTTPKK